jgi:hypothetical protein
MLKNSIESALGLGWKPILHATGFAILPPLLTFAASGTAYESSFRPPPTNISYDSMQVAVSLGIAVSQWVLSKSKLTTTLNAFEFFKILFPLFNGVLYMVVQAWGAGIIWIFWALVIVLTKYVYFPGFRWKPYLPDGILLWIYSLLSFVIAVLFISFAVAQPWSGPPEKFVRWYPFNVDKELVWRGIFLSHALMMIWTALFQPHRYNFPFTVYLAISGTFHSTIMLILNLAERAVNGLNGNVEHIYGDVAGWYFVAFMNALVAFSYFPRAYSTVTPA